MPSAKMVGNMIELNSPIDTTLHLATSPSVSMVATSSAIATSANSPSSLRGSNLASSAEPTSRPNRAPHQHIDTQVVARSAISPWPMLGSQREYNHQPPIEAARTGRGTLE